MENICYCTNCDNLLIDTNPQVNAKSFDVDTLNLYTLKNHKCPLCETDGFLTDYVAKRLWDELGNIPCDEIDDQEIEESFLHFEIGTNKFYIWHWFEKTFDLSVAKDLMCLS